MRKTICLTIIVALLMSLWIPTFAAGIAMVEVNQEWSESWSSTTRENMFLFKCTKTGFYDVVFKDENGTAALWFDVVYETADAYDSPLWGRINFEAHNSNEYTLEQKLFTAGHTYEVRLTYHTIPETDPEYNTVYNSQYICGEGEYMDADISVMFKYSEKEIDTITTQEEYFTIEENVTTWLEFTTTSAGDYLLKNNFNVNASDFYGYVELYEADNMNYLGAGYFEHNNKIFYDLEANTTYYLAFEVSGNANRYSKLSINRVSNPIVDLIQVQIPYDIDPWDPLGYYYAHYKVQYRDGTEEWLDTDEIRAIGYNISSLYYEGEDPEYLIDEYWDYNDGTLYPAGPQRFSVIFRGEEYFFNADIISAFEYFSDLDPVSPEEKCTIEYEDGEMKSYYWRANTDKSGFYSIFSYGTTFSEIFDEYYINIIDSHNRCVEWKNGNEFYLESGEEYLINIRYRYASGTYSDLRWSYKVVSMAGDIDGVEGVTDADAEYLLMYTFFPEDYPVNQDCDFNGDGRVNDADAEHLLMYTFFPEDYPLN